MISTGTGSHPAFFYVNIAFALTFFVVRIVIGLPLSYDFQRALISDLMNPDGAIASSGFSRSRAIFCIISNGSLCALNVYWLSLMVLSLVGGGEKGDKASGDDTSPDDDASADSSHPKKA